MPSYTKMDRARPATVIPAVAGVPGGAVIVPDVLASSVGLYTVPRVALDRSASAVYLLQVLRAPEAPGRPVRAEAVYVGMTRRLGRKLAWHERQTERGHLPYWSDCLYYVEASARARTLRNALVKLLLPLGNRTGKDRPLSAAERSSLDEWHIRH